MKVAIICGKYNDPSWQEIDANIRKAREVAILLWEAGYAVFTPHLNSAHFEVDCQAGEQAFKDGDLEIMARLCTGPSIVVMLDNWQRSGGAKIEREWAIDHDIPVYHWPEDREAIAYVSR